MREREERKEERREEMFVVSGRGLKKTEKKKQLLVDGSH